MGNIKNNNRHNIKLNINYDEYWDFFLNKDRFGAYCFDGSRLYDKCLISYIDTSDSACTVEDDWLISNESYRWESGVSIGYTLHNVGYTGVDNGLFRFRKDRISNEDFIKIYSESDFSFEEDDMRLKLHAISGNTLQYEYPMRIENGLARCNGGFFQGVFKTECDKYQILPSSLFEDVWDFEFVLKKEDFEKESDKTLNDKHPENKGIFFYMGVRAENKWDILYDKSLTSGDTFDTDDVVDYLGMDCDCSTLHRFTDVDWYGELVWWRVNPIENYVDYIYYPDSMYKNDDEYFSDYIFDEDKPIIIDDRTLAKELKDCCTCEKEVKSIVKQELVCCGCGKCKAIGIPKYKVEKVDCHSCLFGADYLDGLDELDYDNDYVAPETDLSLYDFQTAEHGLSLFKFKRYTKIYSDNKFLLFHRAKGGFCVRNWVEDTVVEYMYERNRFNENLFLIMNRTCTGYTVWNIDDLKEQYAEKYNIYEDLYNNALCFRITDEGEVGYRYLSVDCEVSGDNKIKIYEGYSNKGVIKDKQWHLIHVKVIGGVKTMYFKFYVDGRLKYITQEVPLLNLRKLQEEDEKQELVAYNISLGGGTQGLCDVIMPDYMRVYNVLMPLEENFGGTFIGYIKIFRWYNCTMEVMNIRNNYNYEIRRIKL